MRTYTGNVVKVTDVDWNGATLWSFQIEGMNKWFRCGENEPPIATGNAIKFVEDRNKVDVTSIQIVDASEVTATQTTPCATAPASPNVGSTRAVRTTRDVSIEWQSSRKDAIAVACAALDNECLDIPKSAAKGKKFDLFKAIIRTMTEEFYDEVQEKKNG